MPFLSRGGFLAAAERNVGDFRPNRDRLDGRADATAQGDPHAARDRSLPAAR